MVWCQLRKYSDQHFLNSFFLRDRGGGIAAVQRISIMTTMICDQVEWREKKLVTYHLKLFLSHLDIK